MQLANAWKINIKWTIDRHFGAGICGDRRLFCALSVWPNNIDALAEPLVCTSKSKDTHKTAFAGPTGNCAFQIFYQPALFTVRELLTMQLYTTQAADLLLLTTPSTCRCLSALKFYNATACPILWYNEVAAYLLGDNYWVFKFITARTKVCFCFPVQIPLVRNTLFCL